MNYINLLTLVVVKEPHPIDFVISEEGKARAIEVKWGNKGAPKSFNTIKKYYPDIHTELITKDKFIKSL